MPRVIPAGWMPACRMQRVITHWTGGGYHSSVAEEEHYHLLIEGDGTLIRGEHPIDDNLKAGDGDYAAHTRGCNSGSIGVSVCCMAGAMERPFRPGSAPMTPRQYDVLAAVVADLCERYRLPVTRTTVLGHGEVEAHLGLPQRGKWDPLVLPWDPSRARQEVGEAFRARVQALLSHTAAPPAGAVVTVLLDGEELTDEALLLDDTAWCPLRLLADRMGWTLLSIDEAVAQVRTPNGVRPLAAKIRGSRGYVQIRDLCAKLDWPDARWDPASRIVSLTRG